MASAPHSTEDHVHKGQCAMNPGFNRAVKSLCRPSTKALSIEWAFDSRDGFPQTRDKADSPSFTTSIIEDPCDTLLQTAGFLIFNIQGPLPIEWGR
jgi:hypothetical protein